jgi:hypothetical protein
VEPGAGAIYQDHDRGELSAAEVQGRPSGPKPLGFIEAFSARLEELAEKLKILNDASHRG